MAHIISGSKNAKHSENIPFGSDNVNKKCVFTIFLLLIIIEHFSYFLHTSNLAQSILFSHRVSYS